MKELGIEESQDLNLSKQSITEGMNREDTE